MNRIRRPVPGRVALLATALLIGLLPAACGRKGSLEPPPGEESYYPRQYPNPASQNTNPEQP